jgi:glucosamine--fructose-6-phosphate aminotransferase (isomerizing)
LCGIFGCICGVNCAPILHAALKRLEYRGYDSAGVATVHEGKLYVKKDRGKIDEVHAKLNFDDLPGKVGISHTRWATHGAPSKENAHPHTDCKNRVAIVHNGIIENFFELRKELEERGHTFKSATDTEVIAHLVEEGLESGLSLEDAVKGCLTKIKGSFAILAISPDDPGKMVACRMERPLIVGVGEDSVYCASDVPAFLPLTNKVMYLNDNEMVVLRRDSVEITDLRTGEPREPEISTVEWSPQMAEKEGFPHFMLKEIYEQPTVLKDVFRIQKIYLDITTSILNEAENVIFVGCGTSYHACLAASYSLSKLAELTSFPVIASEFVDRYGNVVDEHTVIVAVSQSGETADTMVAVRHARERGAKVVGVVNVMGSSLTRLSHVYLGQNSGPEIGVAATKTFTSQLLLLNRLAIELGKLRGTLSEFDYSTMLAELKAIPLIVGKVVNDKAKAVERIAEVYYNRPSYCFLGRGVNVATAMEGRLKLLELAYVPAISYPAGESKHGFISVVEPGFPVIFVAPNDSTRSKTIGNIMEMRAREADTIALIEEGDREIMQLVDDYIEMPKVPEFLSPIVYVIPLQLFAYLVSTLRGHDPDQPRSLAKSVTVE